MAAYTVDELVPHSGKMSLLDKIVDYGEDWLEAEVHITRQSMFADDDGVPAWVGLEYMAQCIAAFAGLQERLDEKPPKLGFLLGTRKYDCAIPSFAQGSTVRVRAEREMAADNGLNVFNCTLVCGGTEVCAALNVFQPEDVDKFLKEGNT